MQPILKQRTSEQIFRCTFHTVNKSCFDQCHLKQSKYVSEDLKLRLVETCVASVIIIWSRSAADHVQLYNVVDRIFVGTILTVNISPACTCAWNQSKYCSVFVSVSRMVHRRKLSIANKLMAMHSYIAVLCFSLILSCVIDRKFMICEIHPSLISDTIYISFENSLSVWNIFKATCDLAFVLYQPTIQSSFISYITFWYMSLANIISIHI